MKKNKYIAGLMLLVFTTFFSCETLDLSPEDYYGSGNFWKNEAQVNGFLFGVHKQMRDAYQYYWLMGEARGGLQVSGTSSEGTSLDYSSPIKDQDFTKDKTGISNWANFYGKLLNVNLAIKQIEEEAAFLSQEKKDYYLGQLYGIRAWYYFFMYRTWGGVPIVTDIKVLEGTTTAEPLYTPRSSPKEVMDFIKSDINQSETLFGNNTTMGQEKALWSKYATLMLKADIYLWSAKVTTGNQSPDAADINVAESALREVEGEFEFLSDFADVFDYDNKGNAEIIFAIRFLDEEATNWGVNFTYSHLTLARYSKEKTILDDTLDLRGNGILRHEYKFPFFQSYDEGDQRKRTTFLDTYDLDESNNLVNPGLVLRKFLGYINSDGERVYADDIPMYRYADVLLMLAELENLKGNDPSPYINAVRERAFGDNYNEAEHGHANGSFAENELAILMERDKEFVWENKRWFDVRRLQDASGNPLAFSSDIMYGSDLPLLNQSTETHKLLWPVDVNTLNNDPQLEQTPGYN